MRNLFRIFLLLGAIAVIGVLVWQGITSHGAPDPTAPNASATATILNIAVLVFREGLECILVLTAITASMIGEKKSHRQPVFAGAGIAFIATLITWFIAVGIVSNLGQSVSALNLQAATGLLAVVVLLVIMNWFFHKIYWGGWMTMHNRRKKTLLEGSSEAEISQGKLLWGLGLLGFTSLLPASRWGLSQTLISSPMGDAFLDELAASLRYLLEAALLKRNGGPITAASCARG